MDLNFKNIFLILLICVGCYSCQKEIDLKIPDTPPKLVINTVFTNDSGVTINITKSVKALSNQLIQYIDNANVTLIENETGRQETIAHSGFGNYNAPSFIINKTKTYRLVVNAKGFNTCEAEVSMPDVVNIDTCFYTINSNTQTAIGSYSYLDPPIKNYYAVCIYREDSLGYLGKLYITEPDNNVNVSESDNFYMDGCYYYTDDFFNGNLINKTIKFYRDVEYDSLGNPIYPNKIFIQLRNLTREYYLYKWSLNNYFLNESNPFSEPVQIYSNVKNGLGIVGGVSISAKELKQK